MQANNPQEEATANAQSQWDGQRLLGAFRLKTMNKSMNILPEDIADRIYHRRRFWFCKRPKVSVRGVPGTFGELSIDFEDSVLSWKIFIFKPDDLKTIKNLAMQAIDGFKTHSIQMSDQRCGH